MRSHFIRSWGGLFFALVASASLARQSESDHAILAVSVGRESNDEVELEVRYRLGNVSEDTHLGAIVLFGGRSTGYWSYRPATLRPGTHRAVVTVGLTRDAPSVHRSDAFKVRMSGGARATYTYRYSKIWCFGALPCDETRLRELEHAPLEERLSSPQPSIRAAALEEVEAFDDGAKRSLLPALAERVHHAERAVRFNALYAIRDFGLREPMLTLPLVQAMMDPHPGISRVATSVLARLADVGDALAEDALERAATSEDDSTRRYARDGLRRLERERRMASKPTLAGPVPENERDCLEAGGKWGRFGLYQVSECNLPTPDAGAPCEDSIDCVSACVASAGLAETEVPVEGSGTCYGWTITRGTCLAYVENGKIHPRRCVD